MTRLCGKVALVTGASKGIGAGIAKRLGVAGASVAVNFASDSSGAEAVAQEISQNPVRTMVLHGDVSKSADVCRMLDEVNRELGPLDILVNNAGVFRQTPIDELSEDEFHRQFNTNVLGPLLMIRESLRYFASGGGSIINIGSAASRSHPQGYSIYTASKGALDAITGVLAKELASRKIRVNSINPGATLSEGTRAAGLYGVQSEFEKQLVAATPLGRLGTPADIANVALFLASDDAQWLTGEVICATGGLS